MKRKQESSISPFPPITKQKALEIAAQVCKGDRKEFDCYSKKTGQVQYVRHHSRRAMLVCIYCLG